MKKWTLLLLAAVCAAAFGGGAGLVFAAGGEITEDRTVYETDFGGESAGALPSGWTELSPDAFGDAKVENGALRLRSAGDTDESYQQRLAVMLPQGKFTDLENFTYEVTFQIERVTDGNDMRFIGFLYRLRDFENVTDENYMTANNTTTYYQMAVRKQATNASGVEFAQKSPGLYNKWNVTGRAASAENIDPQKEYTAKIVVKGSRVFEYLNETLLISGTMAAGYERGELGIQVANMEARVTKVKVTENPPAYDYSGYADTYRPTTGLVNPPTVVLDVTSKAVYDRAKAGTRAMPATAILHLDKNLNVLNAEGGKIATFAGAMKQFDKRIIPALYITDAETAEAVISMITDTDLMDAFVMSSDPALVEKVRLAHKHIRGVIDFQETAFSTPAELLSAHDTVNAHWAKVAVLSKEAATPEAVDYLEKRLITVWVKGMTGIEDNYAYIARGVNGLVTEDFNLAYTAITAYKTPGTLTRAPYIAAHRGYHKDVPENSLPAARAAYEHGADAVECDIWLTTDGSFVIAHDNDVSVFGAKNADGSPASGRLEDRTLAEVKALRLADGKTEIPTLEEYFAEFQGKDVLHYIEIKTVRSGWMERFQALVEQYGVTDQIVVIIFGDYADQAARLDAMRESLPEVSLGYLTQRNAYQPGQIESFETAEEWVVKYNATYNPFYQKLTKECAQQLNDRGITCWPWTLDSAEQFQTGVTGGYNGITTNECVRAEGFVKRVLPAQKYVLEMGESAAVPIEMKVLLRNGTELSVTGKLQIVQGDAKVQEGADGAFYGVAAGTGLAIVSYGYADESGISYRMYSEPVEVEVKESSQPGPGPSDEPSEAPTEQPTNGTEQPAPPAGCGCGTLGGGSAGGWLMLVLIAVVICAALGKIALKRRAHRE